MANLKGFISSNHDGRVSAMVVAKNLSEAANKLCTSVYSLRQMGWHHAEGEDLAVALENPDVVLYRPLLGIGPRQWTADRSSIRR